MILPKITRARRQILIVAGILILFGAGYFVWQHYKYKLANHVITDAVSTSTDSLYTISYDSLHLDEVTGRGFLTNIRIKPDTARVRRLSGNDRPSVLLDVTIHSITVTGVNSMEALAGKRMVADSVIIHRPEITLYTVRPMEKNTQIELEAGEVYQQILGNLSLIKVGYVLIDSINVSSYDFYKGSKGFDFLNGNIQLGGVLIDSAHHKDTSRILFCRHAAFTVDSFFTYSHNRKELSVDNVAFSGNLKALAFKKIALDRFTRDTGKGIPLLTASLLQFSGVNTNQIVKEKNLMVDSVRCQEITVYSPPTDDLGGLSNNTPNPVDSSGFRNVYSIVLKYLRFAKMNFVPYNKDLMSVGNISLTIHQLKSDRILNVQNQPLKYSHEVEARIASLDFHSKNKVYHYGLKDLKFNSLQKTLSVDNAFIRPAWSEQTFADHFEYQQDRYEVRMEGITLQGIDVETLFDNKMIASQLTIRNTVAKIFRDKNKPLEQKSKVGNYPSQMIYGLDFPLKIQTVSLPNAMIQYREKQIASQKTGTVSFEHTSLNITNITNIHSDISRNNQMKIDFKTDVLGKIPLKGDFAFTLGSKDGAFTAKGEIGEFNAELLNKVSVPMALIRVRQGHIHAVDFNFKGDNLQANGDFVMKYKKLKVSVLKKKDSSTDLKKRGLATFLANLVVQNENPQNGDLRKEHPKYKRDIYKSFFNLVWKTIFTGMKTTVGIP